MLGSLREAGTGFETILIDNGTGAPELERAAAELDDASVMRDAGAPDLIETAGIELDRTLLAYDYLNGEPLAVLDGAVPDPVGPSGAAAAVDRDAFLSTGGFD